jgi:hypothetical protein
MPSSSSEPLAGHEEDAFPVERVLQDAWPEDARGFPAARLPDDVPVRAPLLRRQVDGLPPPAEPRFPGRHPDEGVTGRPACNLAHHVHRAGGEGEVHRANGRPAEAAFHSAPQDERLTNPEKGQQKRQQSTPGKQPPVVEETVSPLAVGSELHQHAQGQRGGHRTGKGAPAEHVAEGRLEAAERQQAAHGEPGPERTGRSSRATEKGSYHRARAFVASPPAPCGGSRAWVPWMPVREWQPGHAVAAACWPLPARPSCPGRSP